MPTSEEPSTERSSRRRHGGLGLASLGVAVLLTLVSPTPARADGLAEAAETSRTTGLPMVVLGTRATCPNCQALKAGIAGNPAVRAVLTQFVSVEVDVDGPEGTLLSRYRAGGTTLPFIYIVAADGTQIAGQSGITDAARFGEILTRAVASTGGPKPTLAERSVEGQRLKVVATRIGAALADGEHARALKLLEPYLPKPPAGSIAEAAATAEPAKAPAAPTAGDGAPDARQVLPGASGDPGDQKSPRDWGTLPEPLHAVADRLADHAETQLGPAATLIGTDRNLIGVVNLLAVNRTWGRLPPVRVRIVAEAARARQADGAGDVVAQAERIDAARSEEEKKNVRRATAIYKSVIADWPGSVAAQLSTVRVGQLEGGR